MEDTDGGIKGGDSRFICIGASGSLPNSKENNKIDKNELLLEQWKKALELYQQGAEHLHQKINYFIAINVALFSGLYAPLIFLSRCFNAFNHFNIFVLVFYQWKEKPKDIKRLYLVMTAILFPLFLFFGYTDEVRVFYLIFPALYLLSYHTIVRIYGEKITNRSDKQI
jgi:hypothetical protein